MAGLKDALEWPFDCDSPDLLEWDCPPAGCIGLTNAELRPDAPFNIRLARAYPQVRRPPVEGVTPGKIPDIVSPPRQPSGGTSGTPRTKDASLSPRPSRSGSEIDQLLGASFRGLEFQGGVKRMPAATNDQTTPVKPQRHRRALQESPTRHDALQSSGRPIKSRIPAKRRKTCTSSPKRDTNSQTLQAKPTSNPPAINKPATKSTEVTVNTPSTLQILKVDSDSDKDKPTLSKSKSRAVKPKTARAAPSTIIANHTPPEPPSAFLLQKRFEAFDKVENQYADINLKNKLRNIFDAKGWPKCLATETGNKAPEARRGEYWALEDSQALLICRDVAEKIPYQVLASAFFPGRTGSSTRHHFANLDRSREGYVGHWED